MTKNYYSAGEWNSICDQCGRRFKSSELKKRWDGLMVCSQDFELRNPQEFVRGVVDSEPLSVTRIDNSGIDATVSYSSAVTDADYNDIPTGTFGFYD